MPRIIVIFTRKRKRTTTNTLFDMGSTPTGSSNISTYEARGVSSDKAGLHAILANEDKGLFPGAFCTVLPDRLSLDQKMCLVMHADGVGTKLALAYAMWRETGDLSVWHGVAQDGLVMNIDDVLCVGDIRRMLISSTIGHNSKLVGDEVLGALIEGRRIFTELLSKHGLDLYSTGGETASVGDLVRTVDLNYTCMASLMSIQVIEAKSSIRAGDVIVGLASSGQASYETRFNSGIGSNGLTSARHDIFNAEVGRRYPETLSPNMSAELVYRGKHWLTDESPVEGLSYGELLLSPTRTYAPIMRRVYEEVSYKNLHGIIHNTGGGQTKVKRFLQSLRAVKDQLMPTPGVFNTIQLRSGTDWREMYQTYNMGSLLEYYVPEEVAPVIIDIAKSFGVDAAVVGYCEPKDTRDGVDGEVFVRSEHGDFTYQ